uniref:Uncharacterized protein n=1 Tax=Arundo donax TaxID=35708 RepID=A0A0A9G8I4_ARUDO
MLTFSVSAMASLNYKVGQCHRSSVMVSYLFDVMMQKNSNTRIPPFFSNKEYRQKNLNSLIFIDIFH